MIHFHCNGSTMIRVLKNSMKISKFYQQYNTLYPQLTIYSNNVIDVDSVE